MGRSRDSGEMQVDPPGIGVTVIMATVSINLLALILPLTMLQVFDRIVPYAAYDTMTVLFWTLALSILADFGLKVARIFVLGQSAAIYEIELSRATLERMVAADTHVFAKDTFGTHTDRLGAVRQLRDHFGGQGRLLGIDLPFTAVFIGMIWFIGGWLVIVPIGCTIAIALASFWIRRWQEVVLESRKSVDRRKYSFLAEILGEMTTVKGLVAEDQMMRRFESLQDQSAQASRALITVASVSQSLGALLGQASLVAMGAVGAYLAMHGHIGMAELAACMLLNGRTIQPMLALLGFWVQMEGVEAAQTRIREIAALPPPAKFKRHDGSFEPSLEFRDVTLHVPGRSEPVLKDLNFHVAAGQMALIAGDDGSGRSSALRMILGEQRPTRGLVLIGGHPARALSERRGSNEIAYVDQEPAIFAGTILENISLFGDREAQTQALETADALGLGKDVFALPLGFDTMIGPGAPGLLPSGVLQKIALARALSRRPSLLLLNNGVSAVDGKSRRQIREALLGLRGQTTIIAVTQHLLRPADVDMTISLSPEPERSPDLEKWLADGRADKTVTPLRLKRTAAKAQAQATSKAGGAVAGFRPCAEEAG